MINIDKALCEEIRDFVRAHSKDSDEAVDLAFDIWEKLSEIERNDDMNGTNELGRLLEAKSIASIAREHGLVPDVSHELGLLS